jgi:hypothetical protein
VYVCTYECVSGCVIASVRVCMCKCKCTCVMMMSESSRRIILMGEINEQIVSRMNMSVSMYAIVSVSAHTNGKRTHE